jgi:DNA-directed RNA polymerase subunit RPC12/RpoP
MSIIDVTDQVECSNPDDECIALRKCICGHEFEGWSMILSIYEDRPTECPYCKRKLFFSCSVRVYQVTEG